MKETLAVLLAAAALGVGFAWAAGWLSPSAAWSAQYAAAEAMCKRTITGQVGELRVVSTRTSRVRGSPELLATRMTVDAGGWRSTWDCQYHMSLMLPRSLRRAR